VATEALAQVSWILDLAFAPFVYLQAWLDAAFLKGVELVYRGRDCVAVKAWARLGQLADSEFTSYIQLMALTALSAD
jgi:hypothetical protein